MNTSPPPAITDPMYGPAILKYIDDTVFKWASRHAVGMISWQEQTTKKAHAF